MKYSVLMISGRWQACAIATLVYAIFLVAPGYTQTALPADIATEIERAAADVNRQSNRDQEMVRRMRSIGMVPMSQQADATYAGEVMGATVVGAIARQPTLATAIVASAVSKLPQARDGIVKSATAAFPAFAGRIRAGAGGATPSSNANRDSGGAPNYGASTPSPLASPMPAQVAQLSMDGSDGAEDTQGMEPIGVSTGEIEDPWEDFNRGVFAVNDFFDTYLLKPIATGYGWLVPEPIKQSVRNGVANVMSPVVLANDLLQFEFRDAAITASRLIANSTMGIGGLFDVASGMGLPSHPADFGQTLHSYGVDSGPYLVLPLLGPSTVRDGFGQGVDVLMHPFTYVLSTPVGLGVTGGRVIVQREQLIAPLDELREGSLDYYSALRSAYGQNRAVELSRGRPVDGSQVDEMFDTFQ